MISRARGGFILCESVVGMMLVCAVILVVMQMMLVQNNKLVVARQKVAETKQINQALEKETKTLVARHKELMRLKYGDD